jgi:TRAP-type C4-dicarboxylate transport system permease small subunit
MRCRRCGAQLAEEMESCPECNTGHPATRTVFDYAAKFEEILLAAALSAMILLVLVQIILRNVFSSGIMGGAEIVRHLVLWVAFLGAGLAAREGKHIRIELAQRVLPKRLRLLFDVLTGIFSVIISGILFYASFNFVCVDYLGQGVISFFNTPVWILQVIIPIGYAVVTLRFARRCIESAYALAKGD